MLQHLDQRQQHILCLLAGGQTITEAAAAVGVHRNTVSNWRRGLPAFRQQLASVQYDQAMHWRDQLQPLAGDAVETIRGILHDTEAAPSVRLRAALAILDKVSTPAPIQPELAHRPDRELSQDRIAAALTGGRAQRRMPADFNPDLQFSEIDDLLQDMEDQEKNDEHEENESEENEGQVDEEVEGGEENPVVHAQSCTNSHNAPLRRTEPKVGRNAPCPCSSGRKFKHCCSQ